MAGDSSRTSMALRRAVFRFSLLLLSFRIPWLVIKYSRPTNRPRKTWSLKTCVHVEMLRSVLEILHNAGPGLGTFPDHTELRTSGDVLGLYVDGLSSSLIIGKVREWADAAKVEPVRLPGYWIHQKGQNIIMGQKPDGNEKVVYFLHGGAYVALSAHPDCPVTDLAKQLVNRIPQVKRSFAIEYRLTTLDSRPSANAFPTQLIDALAGYYYLVNDVGYDPMNIIVVGDSAGGNLALALTRYLVEYCPSNASLPGVPGNLLLLSPWCDLSGSNSGPGSSAFTGADYLIKREQVRDDDAPRAFVAPHGPRFAWTNSYISPACNDLKDSVTFKGFPRTLITAGGAELLLDQIRALKERMARDIGDDLVRYVEGEDAVHDYLVFPWHEPERSKGFAIIKEWVEES